MLRLPVRSRRWNRVLAAVGILYAVSATVLFAWLVVDVWHAESLGDRILQLVLLSSIVCSVWMYLGARGNLAGRATHHWHTSTVQ